MAIFFTLQNRKIELKTPQKIIKGDSTKVAVKVVDIFGNDTMKLCGVKM